MVFFVLFILIKFILVRRNVVDLLWLYKQLRPEALAFIVFLIRQLNFFMNNLSDIGLGISVSWKQAMQTKAFRSRLISAHFFLVSVILILPHFFDFIEDREGILLIDPFLNLIPAVDLSLPVFVCIWGTTALLLYRCASDPSMYITAIYGFVIVIFARIITISLVPLDPPEGLIPLIDPISNLAYGRADYITKDLFFSGHTSSQFLTFLCLTNRKDKIIALISTILVGSMVLVQHVHYTIDVITAPFFTYGCYWLGRELSLSRWYKAYLPLPKKIEM